MPWESLSGPADWVRLGGIAASKNGRPGQSRSQGGIMSMSRRVVPLLGALLGMAAGFASAQDGASKTIRIYAGSAGGGGDQLARQIAAGIAGPLGQTVIVENRVALIAIETVAKAPADNSTLLVQGGTVWTRPLLEQTPWDPQRDFTPVSRLANEVFVLAVNPS